MKCTIPEISWHNRDPVLSLDIQLKTEKEFYRLASGGSDSHVLIWHMIFNQSGSINLDLAADLTRHQRAVNVVKWSPNGKYLASGDDESIILIWKMKEDSEILNILDNLNEQDKECWITLKVLRGHIEDVYDLSWCPNSLFIVSASIDNTVIIWDILKGKSIGLLDGHKGFVQGVSWDPKNQYIATLCTDRYLRIFDIQTKKVLTRTNRCSLSLQGYKTLNGKMERIFHDDTLQTFFRRLCFSPDGNLLVTPAGIIECENDSKVMHTTYIFSRDSLKQPAIILPSPNEYTIVVTFCPLLFKLKFHSESNMPLILLPYRMVFAVATKSSVYLYDTQQKIPFGIISNIHYTRLTDMTWAKDGKILAVSSTDGFCSLLTFSEGELGEIYNSEESEKINECKQTEILLNQMNLNQTEIHKIESNVKNSNIEIQGTFSDCSSTGTICNDNLIIQEHIFNKNMKLTEQKNRPEAPISGRHLKVLSSTKNNEMYREAVKQVLVNENTDVLTYINEKKETIAEETMVAWPENTNAVISDKKKKLIKTENLDGRYQNELTEDIRLFYEDSQEENKKITKTLQENEKVKDSVEECKTPRRVQLQTISTPKSNK